MTTYICKCGRQVKKATNADNTGNRDTEGCKGCPYLLPWGPDKYIEGQGYTKDVQGYECRMSPTISYTTTYRGQANDKCTLHILSLDLDFLDEVQAWIYDNAADTLSAGFSRGSMRRTDFSDKGRYSLSISCTQNKKGMAAKAALLDRFFTGGRVRKDMTLVQEKAHILAAIKEGKENASKMNYIISQHDNGLLYAYYLGTFWFWLADKRWVPSDFAKQEYEKAQKKNPRITPEEFMDSDDFIQMDDYEVPSQKLSALKALTPADSRMHAPDTEDVTDAPAASAEAREIVDECSEPDEECPYLQPLENSKKYNCQCSLCGDKFVNRDICNKSFRGCGWYQDQQEKDARHNDEEEIPATDPCQCRTCEHESCFAHGCAKECPANAEESCLTVTCPEYIERTDTTCNCQTTAAPTGDAAATTVERAVKEQPRGVEISTTSESGADASTPLSESSSTQGPNSSPAPASRADAGAAEQSLSAAGPASLEADERMENPTSSDVATVAAGGTVASLEPSDSTSMMAAPAAKANEPQDDATESVLAMASGSTAFDFGADAETNAALMQDAQIFMAGSMARVMAAKRAHDRTANNYRGSWGKWCDLVGISRDTGDNMVRVAEQFGNIQIDGQNLIDIQPLKLLYATSKPSTPPEIREKVENLDITTYKQYQEALARIRTLENQNASLLHSYETERGKAEAADRRAEEEQRKRKEANEGYAAVMETLRQAQEDAASADARARAAENRADGAEKLAELRGTENTELKAKIQEMENQPRDVAVIQPGEDQIEVWRREGAERMAATMQETVSKVNQEKQKVQNQVIDLQKQLEESRPDADACQRTVDILYETTENLRLLLRSQLKQARLSPNAYGKVVAHVLQAARNLMDTVRVCSPDGYDMDSEEDDDFE